MTLACLWYNIGNMFEPRFITRKEWKAWNFPVDKPLYPMVPMNVVIHHYGDFNNDSTSNSTKNRTARELGIPVITEEEYIALKQERTGE